MCSYVQMLDGTLNLEDYTRMNEYLDIEAENAARAHVANAAPDP